MDVGHVGAALVQSRIAEEEADLSEALWQEHGWALDWVPTGLVVGAVLVASAVSALLG